MLYFFINIAFVQFDVLNPCNGVFFFIIHLNKAYTEFMPPSLYAELALRGRDTDN